MATLLFFILVYLCSLPVLADRVKIAFIGDQGIGSGAQQVLELIRDEGAELVVIQGDLGYARDAASQWIHNMDSILGGDMPVLIVVGNHENYEWPTYLQWQKNRLAATPEIVCEGDIAVKSYCTYKDIGFVFVAPAIDEVDGIDGNDDYAQYITDALRNDNSLWRFCSWHKNMRDMQPGGKGDATGWAVYQSCLAQGGIVLNGHEHSYSRTHLMSSFEAKQVIHTGSDMTIGPDSSIVLLTGLGGREVRAQQHSGDWFASVYTSDQDASVGALFCDIEGTSANCYLKDIAGKVPDVFTLRSSVIAPQPADAVADQTDQASYPVEEDQAMEEEPAMVEAPTIADPVAPMEPATQAEPSAQTNERLVEGPDAQVTTEAAVEPIPQADIGLSEPVSQINTGTRAESANIPTTTLDRQNNRQDILAMDNAVTSLATAALLDASTPIETESENSTTNTNSSSNSSGGTLGWLALGFLSVALLARSYWQSGLLVLIARTLVVPGSTKSL